MLFKVGRLFRESYKTVNRLARPAKVVQSEVDRAFDRFDIGAKGFLSLREFLTMFSAPNKDFKDPQFDASRSRFKAYLDERVPAALPIQASLRGAEERRRCQEEIDSAARRVQGGIVAMSDRLRVQQELHYLVPPLPTPPPLTGGVAGEEGESFASKQGKFREEFFCVEHTWPVSQIGRRILPRQWSTKLGFETVSFETVSIPLSDTMGESGSSGTGVV